MKKVKVHVRTDKIGSECWDEFEIEDDVSDSEMEFQARECMFNMIEWNYIVQDSKGDKKNA